MAITELVPGHVLPISKNTDTGKTLAMFADRENKGFTWYGNAEDIVRQWATQFVEVATSGRERSSKNCAPFPDEAQPAKLNRTSIRAGKRSASRLWHHGVARRVPAA